MKEKELLEKLLKVNKLIVFLLLTILIVLSVGVSKMFTDNGSSDVSETESSESSYNTNYDVSMFKEITAKDVKKETKGKMQVVYIGRESCGWCAAFLPSLWDAQDEYEFKTLYIDIAKIIDFSSGDVLDQEEFDTLTKLTGVNYEGYMEENLGATPMILIIKDNKIINAQTGYTEYDSFEKLLNDSGIN